MQLKHRGIFVVLISCLLLVFSGCEAERETSPISPGQIAVLVISFQPSPVHETSHGDFRYVVFVDEVNNVGATLTSIKLETLDEDGNVQDKDYKDQDWIRNTFGTTRIEPYGRLAASVELEAYGAHRESWVVRGVDDFGNYIEYSQSVELIHR
jgi:hypothetical protein